MEDWEFDDFDTELNELVGAYPNQRFSDDNTKSYFSKMKKYPLEIVLSVLHRAHGEHQDRMPTAGQLVQMCKAVASDAVRETKEYLKRTFGEHYYEQDYKAGIKLGINRPVREVLADDVVRGWADPSLLARYDARHDDFDYGPPPGEEKLCKTPRCKALEEAWTREAEGVDLTKEENTRRLNILMKAYTEDCQDLRDKKFIDSSRK